MRKIVLLLFVILFQMSTARSQDASWIWFPGDFEIWLSNKIQVLRIEKGEFYPPFWRLDSHAQLVSFTKDVDLKCPEIIDIYAEGQYNVRVDGVLMYDNTGKVTIPAGKHQLKISVYNPVSPPSILIEGETIISNTTWSVSRHDQKNVNADSWVFNTPNNKPSDYRLATKAQESKKTTQQGKTLLMDFGRETFGYLKFHNLKGTGRIKTIYGESKEEALSNDQSETWEIFNISQNETADYTAEYSRAFRYIHLSWDGDISFDNVSMLYEYNPLEYKGYFECSDDELNKIWNVSAYTLHLTSREFFLDGIKRDRWLWSGDAYQSYLMNYYLFFDNPLVKRTTWALRGNDPVTTHVNTIMDYSFYWFMGIYDYFLYTGDKEFLQQIYPKMVTLMDFCISRRNMNGMVEGFHDDWVFIDWAPIPKEGEISFEQILFCRSLETMTLCATLLHDKRASEYQDMSDQLRKKILDVFWDDDQKALVHSRLDGVINPLVTKYANMFAVIFDYLTPRQKENVKEHVLLNDKILKITTPYMRFYELEAMCSIKQQKYVLQEIKDYWGGMLRLGASSFWETYDPRESGAEHYAMYDHPFGKSLCHAWGASPIYLLGKYYLGVRPSVAGYEEYVIEPELGGLEWMRGEVPTPSGNISLFVSQNTIKISTVDGNGLLRFRSSLQPICKNAHITTKTNGIYEIALHPNSTYEIIYS